METMRKNLVSKVLRTSAFATACLALAGPNVNAATAISATTASPVTMPVGTQTYNTGLVNGSFGSGISSPSSTTPDNVISFQPIGSGGFGSTATGTAVSIGSFQVATLSPGQETDYKNTPFTITYNPVSYYSSSGQLFYPSTNTPVTITGVLNGMVTGSTSTVVATFQSVSNPVFTSPDGSAISTFSIPSSEALVPSTSNNGITTIQGSSVTTTPSPSGLGGSNSVPEPTTFAILATALVGLGLRKRLRKARLVD
jgi:hypothetical protein